MIYLFPRYTALLNAAVLLAVIVAAPLNNSLNVDAFAPVRMVRPLSFSSIKGVEIGNIKSTSVSESTDSRNKTVKRNKSVVKRKKRSTTSKQPAKYTEKNDKNQVNDPKTFKPLKDLVLGSTVSGTVVDVCDFGAFVNIGYATRGSRAGTALLHVSQIQDSRIENMNDVIKVGDFIEGVRVINVDIPKGEVGLSLRKQRPKRRDILTYKEGDQLEGKVHSVLPYGAFIDVGATSNPLLHISRITGGTIENIRHHLNEGDPVVVHVIDIDEEKKTMAVSMLDKKADQYLDRRMSQRMKRFYGTARKDAPNDGKTELDYFDQAIRELEEALKDRA